MKKVFAFYGFDLENGPKSLLKERYEKEFTILALDIPAIGIAVQSGVPYTIIDDWLDDNDFEKALADAEFCEKNWFSDAKEEFTIEGICWPEYDHWDLSFFWKEFFLSRALCNKLLDHGVKVFSYIKYDRSKPIFSYFPPNTVGKETFKLILKDKIDLQEINPLNVKKILNKSSHIFEYINRILKCIINEKLKIIVNRKFIKLFIIHIYNNLRYILNRKFLKISLDDIYEKISGNIVFVIHPVELFRHSHIIRDYVKNTNEMPVLFLSTDNLFRIIEAEMNFDLPVIGSHSIGSTNDASLLSNAYYSVKEKSNGKLWEDPIRNFDTNFQYYCTKRWPELIKDIRYWNKILHNFSPKALIVSTVDLPEFQLITILGKIYSIPSFSLPHGGVCDLSDIPDYLCYDTYIHKIVSQIKGLNEKRLLPVKRLLADHESPMNNTSFIKNKTGIQIVVITAAYQFHGLIPKSKLQGHIDGFSVFKTIPYDLSDKIQIRIKEHPTPLWKNTGLMYAAEIDIPGIVLPLDTNLHELLKTTDIVIMLNTWSTPIIHALKAKKPVIIFRNVKVDAPLEDQFDYPSGIVVTNPDELWECIRNYIHDKEYRDKMTDISTQFSNIYLDDSNYPNLAETIKSKLEENVMLK